MVVKSDINNLKQLSPETDSLNILSYLFLSELFDDWRDIENAIFRLYCYSKTEKQPRQNLV